MRILIACEMSGIVRRAFRAAGHDAWSCDILPSEDASEFHIQGDVLAVINEARRANWDMMIGFPPCTFLAVCQAWRKHPSFFRALWDAPIHRICLENPKSMASTLVAPHSQTIHPWQFGHGETKTTWLWLKNLPKLQPTSIVSGREQRIWKMSPGKNRSIERSKTYPGIAWAMAEQWGVPIIDQLSLFVPPPKINHSPQ